MSELTIKDYASRNRVLADALSWYAERRNYVPAAPPAAAPPDHLMATDAYDGMGPGARARAALSSGTIGLPERLGGRPRDDEDDAYATFMDMTPDQFNGMILSLMRGGTLTPAEDAGLKRAMRDRPKGA